MKQKTLVAEEHDENRMVYKYFNKFKNLRTTLKLRTRMKLQKNEDALNHRLNRIFTAFKGRL